MKKDLYNIMLSKDIIEEIDKIAYERDVDRSYILNEILAEYLSIKIPELNVKEVFQMVELNMNKTSVFKVQKRLSDCIIYVKSSLKHEYRPELKYSVEMFNNDEFKIGKLKLVFRTYDIHTLKRFNDFINIWISLETHYIHKYFKNREIQYEVENGRFNRTLMMPKDITPATNEILSQAICEYIIKFDEMLKFYLNGQNLDSIERIYLEYINKSIIF